MCPPESPVRGRRFSRLLRLCGAAAALLLSLPGWAGNGFNAYGTGARSMGMAGTDLAVPAGVLALAANPAGLDGVTRQEAAAYLESWWQPFEHRDNLGNTRAPANELGGIFGAGYARRLDTETPMWAGIALFAQGGTGFIYEDLQNQLGTRDEMSAMFGVFRLAPGIAWRPAETLTLAAALGINYSSARQKIFPQTSLPSGESSPGFQGFRLDGADGVSFNGKLGLLYRPTAAWTLALAYTSETEIRLKGGELTRNYDADGLGRVRYRNARLDGLAVPQELGFGAAYGATPRWTLSAEANWIDWSSAIGISTLHASGPDRDGVPADLRLDSAQQWRDQQVYAAAAEFQWTPQTQFRFGYNYGRNPIPPKNLNPLFNLISEHAVAAGLAHRRPSGWEWAGSLLYVPPKVVVYSNPSLGLGSRQRERFELIDLNLTLTRRW